MDLREQVEGLQKGIHELKDKLSLLNDQKEKLFDSRKANSSEISSAINQIKALRDERNKLTSEVRLAKEERTKLTSQIKEKIGGFKRVGRPRTNSGFVRKQIEKLQYQIETEGLTFEKEQKVMKQIHELEKQLKDAKETSDAWSVSQETSKDINDLKKKADDIHQTIQEKAKASQEKHEQLLLLNKKVDELKEIEKQLNEQIDAKKKEIGEITLLLDEKYAQLKDIKKQLGEDVEEKKTQKAQQHKKKLSELQREVEEKMKRGERLTTDDLLILQSDS